MNEDIEIIRPDIREKKKKKDKKEKKPFKLWEKILLSTSIVFIAGCIIFYGCRLVKYYKIYNPKIDGVSKELIMNSIVKNSAIVYENNGLYRTSGMYIYKGENVNNYIKYSNMLFRIIKFNTDGSLDLILDSNINMLKWDDEVKLFTDSDIYKYLNNYFYKLINKDNLKPTTICNDPIIDLNSITCNNKNTESYVRLLSVSEYLNSKTDSSYINKGNIWLSNSNEDKIWNISDSNLSKSDADSMYYVRPVITLKNSTILVSGTGKEDDPFIVEENNQEIGKYVKLGEDIWTIYDKDNESYKLSLNGYLKERNYNIDSVKYDLDDTNSLANYLNNEYYDSLSYKNLLIEGNWYNGEYNNYNDVLNSNVKAKVGILNVTDLKFNELSDYYLMTPSNNKMYLYSETVKDCNPSLYKKIVPTISIGKLNIKSGKGTIDDPYVLEV